MTLDIYYKDGKFTLTFKPNADEEIKIIRDGPVWGLGYGIDAGGNYTSLSFYNDEKDLTLNKAYNKWQFVIKGPIVKEGALYLNLWDDFIRYIKPLNKKDRPTITTDFMNKDTGLIYSYHSPINANMNMRMSRRRRRANRKSLKRKVRK